MLCLVLPMIHPSVIADLIFSGIFLYNYIVGIKNSGGEVFIYYESIKKTNMKCKFLNITIKSLYLYYYRCCYCRSILLLLSHKPLPSFKRNFGPITRKIVIIHVKLNLLNINGATLRVIN
jgi:hypothetical protein